MGQESTMWPGVCLATLLYHFDIEHDVLTSSTSVWPRLFLILVRACAIDAAVSKFAGCFHCKIHF